MLKRILFLIILSAAFLFQACLGEGDAPERIDNFSDEIIGRFMREIGVDEMNILMESPFSANPGLPIEDLLYMIDKISPDKMILLVKQVTAQKTVDLVYSIKRMGCNKAGFNLTVPIVPADYAACTTDDFDHLKIMTELVDGMGDVNKLALLINQESIAALSSSSERYLEKLAFVTVYMEDTVKMIALVNGVIDPRDTVYFIDQIDSAYVYPVNTGETSAKLAGLTNLLDILKRINDPNKLYQLLNGTRTVAGPNGEDAVQEIYIGSKMVPLMEQNGGAVASNPDNEWNDKLVILINEADNVDRMARLVNDVANFGNMIDLLRLCNSPIPYNVAPNENSISTMGYLIGNVTDYTKMVTLVDNVTPLNMASLLNSVASDPRSRVDDSGNPDLTAAGQKLARVIDDTIDVNDLVFVMDSVANFSNMAELINSLKIASMTKMATLMNSITGPAAPNKNQWNSGNPDTATGMGKLVNIIDNITNLSDIAILLDDITDGEKMPLMINRITNSTLLVSLVNSVIADTNNVNVTISDMVSLMNGTSLGNMPKISDFILSLNGTRDQLVADLMAPISGRSQGIGFLNMITLLTDLNNSDIFPTDGVIDSAADLASIMSGLTTVRYGGSVISLREGMVRLLMPDTISGGVAYLGQNFPGVGTDYMAVMLNSADDPDDLMTLLNSVELDQLIPTMGCSDRVGDPDGDGVGPFYPDFHTPCSAIGLGW